MKRALVLLFSFIVVVALGENATTFVNESPKLSIGSSVITWSATNQLRDDLWVYKVVPQHFPASAILNLANAGQFTMQDEQKGHWKISETNEDALVFYSKARLCNLSVIPSQGLIEYWDDFAPANHWDKTNHLWQQVEGVPNMAEAEKLGLELLNQFGIKPEDLAHRADGRLLTFGDKKIRSYFDRRTQTNIEDEVTTLGIYFCRRINGVNVTGIGLSGGCLIQFGNNKKLSDFKLVWRNLQKYEHYKVADKDELMEFIRDGKAVLTPSQSINLGKTISINITNVTTYYQGADRTVQQDLVYPFARIGAILNDGATNKAIQFDCPILTDTKL